jgi:transcriptional regulator with XRE-family HTH domain
MTATILARSARAASGLSQSELALRSGIAGSSLSLIEHGKREPTVATLESLLRAARHTVVTIPTVRSDAAHIASEISLSIKPALAGTASGDAADESTAGTHSRSEAFAFRRFLQLADNLQIEQGATRVGLTLTEPTPTGSVQWDTAIAALCEYRLNAASLPIPDWTSTRTGNPNAPWSPRTSDYEIPVDSARVPAEFLSRGILIEAATLESM